MSNDGGYGGGYGRADDPYGYGEPQYPGEYQQQYPTEQYGAQQPYPTQQYPVVPPQRPNNNQRGLLIALGGVVAAGVVVIILALAGVFSGDSKTVADPTNSPTVSPTVDFPSTSVTSDPTSAFPSPTTSSSSLGTSSSSSLGALCPNTDPIRTVRLFVSGITLSSIDISAGCLASDSSTSRSDVESIISSGQKYSPTVQSGQTGPTFTFTSVDDSHRLTVRVEKQSDGKYYVISASQS